ncbi:vesicle-associated protein 2-1 [Rosa sericea]
MCIYMAGCGKGRESFLSCCSSFKSDGGGFHLISVHPDELRFPFELKKESFCDLKVVNNTEHRVAFKVKTSAPMKFFVRPNMGVIKAQDSCIIRVNLRGQRKYPPNMECKDKFLLQSAIVPPNSDVDELPKYTFTEGIGRTIEECKFRVVYIYPGAVHLQNSLQRLKEERDSAVKQTQILQEELDILKRQRSRKGFGQRFRSWWSSIMSAGCGNHMISVHPNELN